jgi:hypothetical protein
MHLFISFITVSTTQAGDTELSYLIILCDTTLAEHGMDLKMNKGCKSNGIIYTL